MRLRTCLVLAPSLLLAACNDEPTVAGEGDGREASGEILPSSISDEMIHTDSVRSQPPLLSEQPEAAANAEGGEGAAEEASDAAEEAAPEPEAPAEEESAE